MHIGRITWLLSLIVIGGVLLMGCGGPMVRDAESVQGNLKSLAIVPFFVVEAETGQRLATCPVCTDYFTWGEIAPEASDVITSLFRDKLAAMGYQLVPLERVQKAASAMGKEAKKPAVFAETLANKLQVDGVLLGWIFHYHERIGNAWGVQEPASVAFAVFLFDRKKGDILWHRGFDETQKALSEDAFQLFSFIRRGGKWITAQQLASEGVSRMFVTFLSGEPERVNH
jgi:hypothetical protein